MEQRLREETSKKLTIFLVGDNHEGHVARDKNSFERAIQYISEVSKQRKTIVVLMGDMVDCIGHDDRKRFSAPELDPEYNITDLSDLARQQARKVCHEMEPVLPLIKYSIEGNHEIQYAKHHNFDVHSYMCEDLIHCENLGVAGIVHLQWADFQLSLHVTHGVGGGGFREGFPANAVMDTFRDSNADICVMGHLHRSWVKEYWFVDYKTYRRRWFGVGGSFLKKYAEGARTYLEGKRGMMSDLSILELKIDRQKTGYTVILSEKKIFTPWAFNKGA